MEVVEVVLVVEEVVVVEEEEEEEEEEVGAVTRAGEEESDKAMDDDDCGSEAGKDEFETIEAERLVIAIVLVIASFRLVFVVEGSLSAKGIMEGVCFLKEDDDTTIGVVTMTEVVV